AVRRVTAAGEGGRRSEFAGRNPGSGADEPAAATAGSRVETSVAGGGRGVAAIGLDGDASASARARHHQWRHGAGRGVLPAGAGDSAGARSEEHTSELQSR